MFSALVNSMYIIEEKSSYWFYKATNTDDPNILMSQFNNNFACSGKLPRKYKNYFPTQRNLGCAVFKALWNWYFLFPL